MKRVLILASVASMIDQFNMPNIKLLKDMGFAVDVACNFVEGNTCSDERIIELKHSLDKMDVRYYQIDFARNVMGIGRNIRAFRQVKSLLRKNKYEFLHCHSPIGGVVGRIAGKMKKTRVIYTVHGFHFYKGAALKNWLVYYPIEKICSFMTDVLICINKEDFVFAQKKMHAKRIEYLPGIGIDLKNIAKIRVDHTAKRHEIGIPDDAVVFLSVGELNKNKNHESVVRAIGQNQNKNIVYLIVGRGEKKEALETLAKKLEIHNRIFLMGYRTDVLEIMQISDIYVFPSFREGLSVSLMEAMASELSVICSRIRGNTDLIDEGKGGYCFDPGNVEEISACMNRIVSKNFLQMGRYNKTKIKEFDLLKVLAKERIIYSDCVKSQR